MTIYRSNFFFTFFSMLWGIYSFAFGNCSASILIWKIESKMMFKKIARKWVNFCFSTISFIMFLIRKIKYFFNKLTVQFLIAHFVKSVLKILVQICIFYSHLNFAKWLKMPFSDKRISINFLSRLQFIVPIFSLHFSACFEASFHMSWEIILQVF